MNWIRVATFPIPCVRMSFRGEMVDALSFSVFCSGLGEHVGVHLMIHDHDDVRGALKPAADGRPARGDEQALRARMLEDAASIMN